MPNWCSTRFTFRGKTDEIQLLHNRINEWTSKSYTSTDFGDPWLGNILHGAGLVDRIDCPDEKKTIPCRGTLNDITEVTEYDSGISEFFVYTETAWVPMGRMWQAVIEALDLHSVHFAFIGDELGNGLYQKYDPYNLLHDEDEEWLLDMNVSDEPELNIRCTDDSAGVFYLSENELRSTLQGLFDTDVSDIDMLLNLAVEYKFSSNSSYIAALQLEVLTELRD